MSKQFLFNPDFRMEAARKGEWGELVKAITDDHFNNYYLPMDDGLERQLKDDDREEGWK